MKSHQPKGRNKSLKQRLMWRFAFFVTVIVGLFITTVIFMAVKGSTRNVKDALAREADYDLKDMEQQVFFWTENVKHFTSNDIVVNGLLGIGGKELYLSDQISDFNRVRDISEVFITDLEGNVIYSSEPHPPGDLKSMNLKKALAKGKTLLEVSRDRKSVIIASPIAYYQNLHRAVIAEFSIASMCARILPKTGSLYYRVYSGNQPIFSQNVDSKGRFVMVKRQAGNGLPRLKKLGIELEIGELKSVYLESVRNDMMRLGLMGLAFIGLAVLLAAKMGNGLASPILKLCAKVDRSETFQEEKCYPVGTGDELETLAQAFDNRAEQLVKTRNYATDIIQAMPDPLFVVDPDATIRTVNQAALGLLGYEEQELVGRPFTLTLEKEKQGLSPASETVERIKKESFQNLEQTFLAKDGREIIVLLNCSRIKENEGNTDHIVLTGRDITDHKKAEEALSESEEKYRTILDSIEEAYFEIDLAGNFTFFNDALIKTLGYTSDELVGMNNRQYMPPDSAQKIYEAFNQMYRTGNPIKKVDYEVTRKDGKHGFHELSASMLRDKSGRPIGFRGVAHDITERKLAEQALHRAHLELEKRVQERTTELAKVNEALKVEVGERKRAETNLQRYSERLEEMVGERTRELRETQQELVNKAMEAGRSQLSAMVLHNIGNAVTPVKILMEEARKDEFNRLNEYLDKCYLDLSEKRSRLQQYIEEDPKGKRVFSYLGDLIDSLKEYGKKRKSTVEKVDKVVSYISNIITLQQRYAAKETEIKEETDLNLLVEDAVLMQAGALEKREIILRKELEEGLPKLLIEKSRLVQAMVNLIKNSYEALDEVEGGERTITIKTYSKDGDLYIEIADSGVGITARQMETIFEFGKSHKGSSGVGLYYCKKFVEASMGTLTVTSPGRGRGAKAVVCFPSGQQKSQGGHG